MGKARLSYKNHDQKKLEFNVYFFFFFESNAWKFESEKFHEISFELLVKTGIVKISTFKKSFANYSGFTATIF